MCNVMLKNVQHAPRLSLPSMQLSGSHSDITVSNYSACSSIDDRYASLREAASTHSVLSMGVSCFQRAAEVDVERSVEDCTTWSVSTFSILLLSQVTIIPSVTVLSVNTVSNSV